VAIQISWPGNAGLKDVLSAQQVDTDSSPGGAAKSLPRSPIHEVNVIRQHFARRYHRRKYLERLNYNDSQVGVPRNAEFPKLRVGQFADVTCRCVFWHADHDGRPAAGAAGNDHFAPGRL